MTRRITRLRPHAPLIALALVVAVAIGVRLYLLTTIFGRIEGDEGITAVMAQRILDGHFPVYFGIQSYQGALEQYLQAPVLWLLPDNPFTLRLVQMALVGATLVVTCLVGARVMRSRWGGVLAAALLMVGPYYFTWKGVKSHGGYDGAMLFGLVMVLAALMLRTNGRHRNVVVLVVGLSAGVAVWENPTALYMVIPAAIWAIGSARGALVRLLPWGLGGLLIGIAPMLVHMVRTGVILPTGSADQPTTSFLERFQGLLDPVLPNFTGVTNTLAEPGSALAIASTVIVFLALAAAVWHRRLGLWDLLRLKRGRRRPIDLIILGLVLTPLLYALSPFTWFMGEPRYLFTLYPFAAIAVAYAVMSITVREFRMAAVTTTLIGATFMPSVALAQEVHGSGYLVTPAIGPIYSEDLPAVAALLEREGVTTAYGNIWLSGQLQLVTSGRVQVGSGLWTQFPEVDEEVRRSRAPAIVVPAEPGGAQVRRALTSSGRTFIESTAGRFAVFTDIEPPWHPAPESFIFHPR